jgi:hypothetical protein
MSNVKVLFGAVVLGATIWWLSHSSAAQSQVAESKSVRWEYISELIDANSIQAKLTEWSQANWELVTVTTAISTVEPGEKPSLRVEKYMLTAKRPLK